MTCLSIAISQWLACTGEPLLVRRVSSLFWTSWYRWVHRQAMVLQVQGLHKDLHLTWYKIWRYSDLPVEFSSQHKHVLTRQCQLSGRISASFAKPVCYFPSHQSCPSSTSPPLPWAMPYYLLTFGSLLPPILEACCLWPDPKRNSNKSARQHNSRVSCELLQ